MNQGADENGNALPDSVPVSDAGTAVEVHTIEGEVSNVPAVWSRSGDLVGAFSEQYEQRFRIAEMIAKSGIVKERRPEAIMALQLKAFELGLPLMAALGGMFFVDGKVGLETNLLAGLATTRCGVTWTVVRREWSVCELVLHREGWDDVDSAFDLHDAKRAGLVVSWDREKKTVVQAGKKYPWRNYPQSMCFARALSNGLRMIAPDYFLGVYHEDELAVEMATASGVSTAGADLDTLEPSPEELNDAREIIQDQGEGVDTATGEVLEDSELPS